MKEDSTAVPNRGAGSRWSPREMRVRHGLIVDTAVISATGTAERDAAIMMLGELPLTTRRLTVGADKLYDTAAWVAAVRRMRITPHVAQSTARRGGSAIDQRTTRHAGYELSQ